MGTAGLPEGVDLGNTLMILGGIFLVTLSLRALPFAAMRFFRSSPLVAWLGLAMPAGVMTALVMYTMHGNASGPGGWTAVAVAVAVTAGLHLWRRSSTLSILVGTVVYMLLVNLVF